MSRLLPARTETSRQALREALEQGPRTAHELSAAVGIPERDVVGHLEHLERTTRGRGETFLVEPPRCGDCGFVFKKRERLGRPGRCPLCRSDHVVGPRFSVEKR
jgi:predicted Zn-ribbon and HTH transcriptional regulator